MNAELIEENDRGEGLAIINGWAYTLRWNVQAYCYEVWASSEDFCGYLTASTLEEARTLMAVAYAQQVRESRPPPQERTANRLEQGKGS